MAANALLTRLATVYSEENIRHPQLRAVTLAQWILESGRATSDLAKTHYNFGGLKWRPEMASWAKKIKYEANDGVDFYCHFATLENFINGYWAFLNRSPYSGWEEHVSSAEDFIGFIGPIYTPSANYGKKVLALLKEASDLLTEVAKSSPQSSSAGAKDLGTIVIDPGHGGTTKVGGSSPNNAISASGVKEKKLALDFSMILRDALIQQASKANERINVVLTRTGDVNVGIAARAHFARDNDAKLFFCLHFNGLGDASVRRVETFYRAKVNGNVNLNDDMEFATIVQGSVFKSLKALDSKSRDGGIKPDTDSGPGGLGVLKDADLGNTASNALCRSAYMELEFISNLAVDRLLISGPNAIANRTEVMAQLAKDIRAYMRTF
jgi:N-acetylmuramoyl-L-alanine amidase